MRIVIPVYAQVAFLYFLLGALACYVFHRIRQLRMLIDAMQRDNTARAEFDLEITKATEQMSKLLESRDTIQ